MDVDEILLCRREEGSVQTSKEAQEGEGHQGRISFHPETYRDNLSLTMRHVPHLVANIQYDPIVNCGLAAERDHTERKAKEAKKAEKAKKAKKAKPSRWKF